MDTNNFDEKTQFLEVRLDEEGKAYIFPIIKNTEFGFNPDKVIKITEEDFNVAFEFSYKMTFGHQGEHNPSSFTSDSGYDRKPGEIFVNTFQGKLSEVAVHKYCLDNNFECSNVDFTVGQLEFWDNIDLVINKKNVSVKSTKGFSRFLLLEVKNYDEQGNYKYPYNKGFVVDSYLLCRVQGENCYFTNNIESVEGIFKQKRWLYSENLEFQELFNELSKRIWYVEITGFVSKKKLSEYVIKQRHIMKEGKIMGKSNEK
ncbi:hypothetical protein [Streptococcus ovis]|uniref:hypothetical protein n=1 Tax=Streptococcus ovis TaxID=82806 RepID=UPI000368CDB8|nr:hypothetical protein [Streptococcus ovis]